MPRMKQIKTFDPLAVPNTIIKFKPYIYGTQDDIHHPDCKVEVKVDIWVVAGIPVSRSSSFWKRKIDTNYIQRVLVDFEKRELIHKGEKIDATNVSSVFEVLEDMLRS